MKPIQLLASLGFIALASAFDCSVPHNAPAAYQNEQKPRDLLKQNGISVNLGCQNAQANLAQTCLAGTEIVTIGVVISLQKLLPSNCDPIVVTGAAEVYPHGATSTHAKGQALDLRMTSCLSQYIVNNMQYQGLTAGTKQKYYKSGSGNFYLNEGTHWHLQVCQNS
ncbi:hypothetical protein K7432_007701 [Basidiobolus ranarum]|uniref:Uncharacterized protein n=1 Tax=Basidiobolus ranarum TaxID=34480 RepID=A0ABR2VZS5_9FUNG